MRSAKTKTGEVVDVLWRYRGLRVRRCVWTRDGVEFIRVNKKELPLAELRRECDYVRTVPAEAR